MCIKKLTIFMMMSIMFLTNLSVAVASEGYEKTTMLLATANPDNGIQAFALKRFKETVERESEGQIKVLIFLGGSMGSEQANVKQLRSGELHIAQVAAGNLTPFAPSATLVILPYLFPKVSDAYKLFSNDAFVAELADNVARESGTRPLSWLIGGYRVLTNSKRPVTNMGDLKGLKIRVPPARIQLDSFRSWGVEPHPLAWSETFNGLQQGVINGQENPHSINRDQKFWEVQEYITNLHYMLWVGPMLVSERWYQGLPEKTRLLVDRAIKEAAIAEWEWSEVQNDLALAQCIEKGMIVADLTDEEDWIKNARKIWSEYYDAVGGKARVDEALRITGQQ